MTFLVACIAFVQTSPGQDTADSTFDLTFKGGTVAEYVAAVRKADPVANILIMPEAEDVPIPAMELQRVDLSAAMSLLDDHSYEDAGLLVRLDVHRVASTTRKGVEIYSIRAQLANRGSRQAARAPQRTTVLSVADLIQGEAAISAEDLLTAIEAAMALTTDDYEPTQIRFHDATGLLIARGSPEQAATIAEVVDQLRGSVYGARRDQKDAELAERDAMLQQLEMKIRQVEQERNTIISQFEARIAQLESEIAQRELVIVQLQNERDKK
jgi:hypothetical protein